MDFKTTQKWAKIFGILTLGGLLARCFASSIAIAVGTASFFIGLLGLAAVVLLFSKCPHCHRQIRPFEVDQCPHCHGRLE